METTIDIQKITKQQLLNDFKNYVIHKGKIIQNSNHPHYKNVRILKSLDKCREKVKILQEYKLRGVATAILNCREELVAILPVINNPSFEGSQYQLARLLDNCQQVLNNLNHKS